MVPQPDCTIISPSDFNAIPDIHNQVDFPNDPTLITALDEEFKKYDVHERFGIHLLQRHFVLPESCLMLKSKVDAEISLTKITSLHSVEQIPIRGVLYLLNDVGSFQAYEYEHGDTIDIPLFFLEELSGILRKFRMEKVIALDIGEFQAGHNSFPSFEYVLGDTATVTVQLDKKVEPHHRQTGFTFVKEDDKLGYQFGEVYAEKKNTHQVFYDKNCRLPTE